MSYNRFSGYRGFVALIAALLLLSACGGRESTGNSTRSLIPYYEVISLGDGQVYANAYIRSSRSALASGEVIELVRNEQLRLLAGGMTELDEEDLFASLAEWEATTPRFDRTREPREPRPQGIVESGFSSDPPSDAPLDDYYFTRLESDERQYHVGFFRQGRESALNSSVALPEPFDIQAPDDEDLYSVSNDYLELQWSPSNDPATLRVEITTECPDGDEQTLYSETLGSDPGSYSFPPGSLTLPEEAPVYCEAELAIIKYRTERVDARFHRGLITGYQIRTRTIELME